MQQASWKPPFKKDKNKRYFKLKFKLDIYATLSAENYFLLFNPSLFQYFFKIKRRIVLRVYKQESSMRHPLNICQL